MYNTEEAQAIEAAQAQSSIESVNSWICLIIGGFANLFLLWLIKNKSTAEMKVYSRMLSLLSYIELANLLICVIVQPEMLNNKVYFGNLMGGPFACVPQPLNIWIYNIWMFITFLTLNIVPILFFYRYLIFCRNKSISVGTFYRMLIFPAILSLGGIFFQVLQYYREPTLSVLQAKAAIFPDRKAEDVVGVFGRRDTIYSYYANAYMLTMIVFDFAADILFSFLIWRHIAEAFGTPIQRKNKAANQQIMVALIIQALAPLFLALLPIAISAFFTLLDMSINFLGLSTILNWSPVLNPIITMLVVAPYRKFIFCSKSNRIANQMLQSGRITLKILQPPINTRRYDGRRPSSCPLT